MAFSFLFGRGHGALPLQLIDQLEYLGEKLDQLGASASEPAIALGHRPPLRALAFGNRPHALAALFRYGQHPTLVQVPFLAAAAGFPTFSAQVVGVSTNQGAALLQRSEQVADLPLPLLKLFSKPAGVHICTFISILVYRFAQKTNPRNFFLKIFQPPVSGPRANRPKTTVRSGDTCYPGPTARCSLPSV